VFDAKEMYIADIVMHVIIESGLDDRGSIPVTSRYFVLHHTVQTVTVKVKKKKSKAISVTGRGGL
jgi:hypothetical protein